MFILASVDYMATIMEATDHSIGTQSQLQLPEHLSYLFRIQWNLIAGTVLLYVEWTAPSK